MCGECAGCLWARERYAMSALRCFITPKAKLKDKTKCNSYWARLRPCHTPKHHVESTMGKNGVISVIRQNI